MLFVVCVSLCDEVAFGDAEMQLCAVTACGAGAGGRFERPWGKHGRCLGSSSIDQDMQIGILDNGEQLLSKTEEKDASSLTQSPCETD